MQSLTGWWLPDPAADEDWWDYYDVPTTYIERALLAHEDVRRGRYDLHTMNIVTLENADRRW